MSFGELSFESPTSVRVTWSIPNFFRMAVESNYSLRSPDFTFADGRHCLRLFQPHDQGSDRVGIELLNSTDTDPETAVLYEVELRSVNGEIDWHRHLNNKKVFQFYPRNLEYCRDLYVPDGTMTVLCYVRPGRAGSAESGGIRVFPEYIVTGNLSSVSFPFLYVTWRFPEFFLFSRGPDYILESPEFPFSDRRYRLRLFPSGDRNKFVYAQLVNTTDTALGRYVSYEVGLKSTTGEEINRKWGETCPIPIRDFYILRSELDAMSLPDFPLTVYCSMRSREPSSAGSPKSGGAESPGSESFAGRTSNEEQDKEAAPDISKLLSDLRQLLQKMPDSDACLVVSGREFRAHQIILRARSKVFDAMFGHETPERESGRVVIDDLDPDSFGDFLEYLYTGSVGAGLSDDNAFGLHEAADKYDVPALKAKCVAHMRGSLSVDSFCDVLALALQHSEEELLSTAVQFFKVNMARIVVTAKWQQFVIDNGKSANELFIKAFGQ